MGLSWSWSILLLLLAQLARPVCSNGRLYVGFLNYSNPEAITMQGHCCDGTGSTCSRPCDLIFQVSISGLDGHNFTNVRPSSRPMRNNLVSFSLPSQESGFTNPLSFDFTTWPGRVSVRVEVLNKEENQELTKVDEMDFNVTQNDPQSHYDTQVLHGKRETKPTTLVMMLRYECSPTYFGSNCSIDCLLHPNESTCPGAATLFPTSGVPLTSLSECSQGGPFSKGSEQSGTSTACTTQTSQVNESTTEKPTASTSTPAATSPSIAVTSEKQSESTVMTSTRPDVTSETTDLTSTKPGLTSDLTGMTTQPTSGASGASEMTVKSTATTSKVTEISAKSSSNPSTTEKTLSKSSVSPLSPDLAGSSVTASSTRIAPKPTPSSAMPRSTHTTSKAGETTGPRVGSTTGGGNVDETTPTSPAKESTTPSRMTDRTANTSPETTSGSIVNAATSSAATVHPTTKGVNDSSSATSVTSGNVQTASTETTTSEGSGTSSASSNQPSTQSPDTSRGSTRTQITPKATPSSTDGSEASSTAKETSSLKTTASSQRPTSSSQATENTIEPTPPTPSTTATAPTETTASKQPSSPPPKTESTVGMQPTQRNSASSRPTTPPAARTTGEATENTGQPSDLGTTPKASGGNSVPSNSVTPMNESTGRLTTSDPPALTRVEDTMENWPIILGCILGGLLIVAVIGFIVYNNRQKTLQRRQEIYTVTPKVVSKVEENGTSGRSDVAIETESV